MTDKSRRQFTFSKLEDAQAEWGNSAMSRWAFPDEIPIGQFPQYLLEKSRERQGGSIEYHLVTFLEHHSANAAEYFPLRKLSELGFSPVWVDCK